MVAYEDIQNLLFLGFLILLTTLFIYGLRVGFANMIKLPPTGAGSVSTSPSPTDNDALGDQSVRSARTPPAINLLGEPRLTDSSRHADKEGFLDFGLSRILASFDSDGNLIIPEDPEPKVVPMEHAKNVQVRERLEEESKSKSRVPEVDSEPDPTLAVRYLEDRYPEETKYRYDLMDAEKESYLTLLGYRDGADIYLSVRAIGGKKKEITKIKHKLYGVYECIYKRSSDDSPRIYRFERTPDLERFMKISSEKEEDPYFLKKIPSQEREYQEGSGYLPLAHILYFSDTIGTISSKEGSQYKIEMDEGHEEDIDVIAFGWALHQSLLKAENDS